MNYKVRTGILYRTIADEHFLISFGETARICPAIRQINKGAAFYWELLEKGLSFEQMLSAAAKRSGADEQTLRPGLEAFLNALLEGNYILPEDAAQT